MSEKLEYYEDGYAAGSAAFQQKLARAISSTKTFMELMQQLNELADSPELIWTINRSLDLSANNKQWNRAYLSDARLQAADYE